MKRSRLVLWIAIGATLAALGWYIFSLFNGRPFRFKDFQTRMLLEQVEKDPEWSTLTGLPFSLPMSSTTLVLTDRTPEGIQARIDWCISQRALLQRYNPEGWDAENQLAWRHAHDWLNQRLEALEQEKESWPIASDGEPFSLLLFFCEKQPIRTNEEGDSYLSRLQWLPDAIYQIEDRARAQLKAGKVPNRFLIEQTIGQLRPWATLPALKHPLYTSLAFRISQSDPTALNQGRGLDMLQTALPLVTNSAIPALQHMLDFLEKEALPASNDSLPALPDSQATYFSQWLEAHPLDLKADPSSSATLPQTATALNDTWDDAEDWERKSRRWVQGVFPPEWKAPRLALFPLGEPYPAEKPIYVAPQLSPGSVARLVLPTRKINDQGWTRAQLLQWGIPGEHFVRSVIRSDTTRIWVNRLAEDEVFWDAWALYAGWLMEKELKVVTDSATLAALNHDRNMAGGAILAVVSLYAKKQSPDTVRQMLTTRLGLGPEAIDQILIQALTHPVRGASVWVTYQNLLLLRQATEAEMKADFYLADYHARLLREVPATFLQMESWTKSKYFVQHPPTRK